jgi:hypothetical protein
MTREGIQKAVVAVVGAVVTVLAVAGIDADPEVVAAVSTVITAVAVWAIPNSQTV